MKIILSNSSARYIDLVTLRGLSHINKECNKQLNPNTFLLDNAFYIQTLSTKDHMDALIYYAQQDNLLMLKYIKKHSNEMNKSYMKKFEGYFTYEKHCIKEYKDQYLLSLMDDDNMLRIYKGEPRVPEYSWLSLYAKQYLDPIRDTLSAAAGENDIIFLRLSLKLGMDIKFTQCYRGDTLLHNYGCFQNRLFVDFLLNHPRTDVNAQNALGNTPLHDTCSGQYFWDEIDDNHNHTYLFSSLLKHPKIDIAIQNNNGYTPLDILLQEYNRNVSRGNYYLAPVRLRMISKIKKRLMLDAAKITS